MPITPKQLEWRKQHIGSSDMAAILNEDPFRTAWDVWAEKTGKLVEDRQVTSAVQERGNYMEGALLNWFADTTGKQIVRNQPRSAKKRGLPFAVNLDAEIPKEPAIVEAKSQGLWSNEVWGTPGTDEMPNRVLIQCQFQMTVALSPVAYIPAYLPGREFCLYVMEFNKDLDQIIMEAGVEFWQNNVLKDIPPEHSLPSERIYRRFVRTAKKFTTLPKGLICAYDEAGLFVNEAEARKEQAKAAIMAHLLDAEEGIEEETGRRITNFEYSRRGFDTKQFQADHPELAAQYEKATRYRSFKFPKK